LVYNVIVCEQHRQVNTNTANCYVIAAFFNRTCCSPAP